MAKFKCWSPGFYEEHEAKEVDGFNENQAAENFAQKAEIFETLDEAESGADVYVKNVATNKVVKFRVIGWAEIVHLAIEFKQ